MATTFILGRRGTGKTSFVINEIKQKVKDQPLGPPIILIAPKQSTFDIEEAFASDHDIKGSMRASIYGFDRLSYRILSEEGGLIEPMISTSGVEMLTYIILNELKSELKLYKNATKYFGFSQKLTETIKEFKKYNVMPSMLFDFVTQDVPVRTKEKMHDIGKIYEAINNRLENLYVQSEDVLNYLIKQVPKSETIKQAEIYIDGFYNFTEQEYALISALSVHAKQVTITLMNDYNDDELFRKTNETRQLLLEALSKNNVVVNIVKFDETYRFNNDTLKILERNFGTRRIENVHAHGVTITESVHQFDEAQAIARYIHRQVREGTYRYSDIAILYRDNVYVQLFQQALTNMAIPFTTDLRETMVHHPVIELVRSLLDFAERPYQSEHLFRALKTGLIKRPTEDDSILIDMLENVVIERGLSFKQWDDDAKFFFEKRKPYDKARFDLMNQYRIFIKRLMTDFLKIKDKTTAKDFASFLFEFLERIQLPNYLIVVKDQLMQQEQFEEALKNDQVYDGLLSVINDFVEIAQGEFKFSTLKEMFDVGLQALEFKLIPQSLDEVEVLNLDLAKVENKKVVYVCGLNEDILPKNFKNKAMITDQDKALLEENLNITLAPSSLTLALDEDFVMYQAITHATDEVHLSYSLMDTEHKGLTPSRYIKTLQSMLNLEIKRDFTIEELVETMYTAMPYVLENRTDQAWQPVLQFMRNIPMFNELYTLKDYKNDTVPMTEEEAFELYGTEIKASVSRFETYNDCPFKHFAQHGLKLYERIPFEFQNFELGTIFHEALSIITDELNDKIVTMSLEDIENYVTVKVDDIIPDVHYQVLYSKNYYYYLIKQIKRIIVQSLKVIQYHQMNTNFKMARFEQNFSADNVRTNQFDAMKLTTTRGVDISVRGQIDRIDLLETADRDFVSIIDYKSSKHQLDLLKVYYGKQMQMLTYMDVALQNKEKLTSKALIPAAMLYFHVKAPRLKFDNNASVELEETFRKEYQMDGYILDDIHVASHIDKQLMDKGKSNIIKVQTTKSGEFYKKVKRLTEEHIYDLIDINRNNFIQTAEQIMCGTTEVKPLKFDNQLPCDYCSFKSACHIDPLINDYKEVDEDIDVLQLLEEERS